MQRQQAKENELRQEVVQLQGRERTALSEVESKNQDIDTTQRELGRLKGDARCPHPACWLGSICICKDVPFWQRLRSVSGNAVCLLSLSSPDGPRVCTASQISCAPWTASKGSAC